MGKEREERREKKKRKKKKEKRNAGSSPAPSAALQAAPARETTFRVWPAGWAGGKKLMTLGKWRDEIEVGGTERRKPGGCWRRHRKWKKEDVWKDGVVM